MFPRKRTLADLSRGAMKSFKTLFMRKETKKELNRRLAEAIGHGDIEQIKCLLDRGASPNAEGVWTEGSGRRPIIHHIFRWTRDEREVLDIIKVLVRSGANLNSRDILNGPGNTVLMNAASFRLPDVVEWLINNGANLEIKNDKGKNVFQLIKATNNWDYRAVRGLVARSSDDGRQWLESVDGKGWIATVIAKDPMSARYLPLAQQPRNE